MSDAIIDMAQKLGKAIQESSQAATLRDARNELNKHQDVLDALQQYQDQFEKINKLEEEQKPIEVFDKRRLEDLHKQLVSNEIFKKFNAAQVEYVDLMQKVSSAMRKQLGETEQD